MQHVFQYDEAGCGIACVAMLAGVTYPVARHVIEMFNSAAPTKGTSVAHLVMALRYFGLRCNNLLTALPDHDYSKLKKNALISVTTPKGSGHWVVWDAKAKKIRDPSHMPWPEFIAYGYLIVEN